MTDIINYVDSHIDDDDLATCVHTGVESEKYTELGKFMDGIMEDFDIHFLYILLPVKTQNGYKMLNIFSADTAQGREEDPDGYVLNTDITQDYSQEDIALYVEAMKGDGIVFFKNFSVWGYDYTGLKNLYDSKGDCYGALCVDIDIYELREEIRNNTIVNIALIVILGNLFIGLFIIWLNKNITEPISRLEKSVVDFARKSHDQKDPEMLKYDDPKISTHNEVESLSNAVAQMAIDMKAYVKNIIDAEDAVEDMKSQVNQLDTVAYQDALTRVKNKAWYDETKVRLEKDIAEGKARFGILMMDLNNLKKINDNYGHERGNDYIVGGCHLLCTIFNHSPVFRIGGDEFVVLLENNDYDNRDNLFYKLKGEFIVTSKDMKRVPWERYSAAFGMSTYDSEKDKTVDEVFERADNLMYKDKMISKMGR